MNFTKYKYALLGKISDYLSDYEYTVTTKLGTLGL